MILSTAARSLPGVVPTVAREAAVGDFVSCVWFVGSSLKSKSLACLAYQFAIRVVIVASEVARRAVTMDAGAVSGEPESNGRFGLWLRDLTATPPPRGSASRCKRMSSGGLFREWPVPNQVRAGFRTRPHSRDRPARSGCRLRGRRQNRHRREAPSSRCHFGQDLWFRNEDDLVVGDLVLDR